MMIGADEGPACDGAQIDWQPRHLDWPDCLNARDLGGTPTSDGGRIRHQALVRTEHHGYLTDEGLAAVRDYEITRIVDLRREHECASQPSPFADTSWYVNVSVQDPADPNDGDRQETLTQIYTRLLDRRPDLFALAVREIATAPAGAVIVHCAAGKDRTGLVVALALTLAGVHSEVIAADYAVTEQRLRPRSSEIVEAVMDPVYRERVRYLQTTSPHTMLEVLEHLSHTYGGVREYLAAGGLDAEERATLTRRLRSD